MLITKENNNKDRGVPAKGRNPLPWRTSFYGIGRDEISPALLLAYDHDGTSPTAVVVKCARPYYYNIALTHSHYTHAGTFESYRVRVE